MKVTYSRWLYIASKGVYFLSLIVYDHILTVSEYKWLSLIVDDYILAEYADIYDYISALYYYKWLSLIVEDYILAVHDYL